MPIMALLGALMVDSPVLYIPVGMVILLAIPCILWVHVGRKVVGLYWYAMGSRKKTAAEQFEYCQNAVKWDPNSYYVARTVYLAVRNGKLKYAWDLCEKAINNFDGYTTLASLYAQVAKMALLVGAFNVAEMYNSKSLELDPGFVASLDFRAELERIKMRLQRRQENAEVEMR